MWAVGFVMSLAVTERSLAGPLFETPGMEVLGTAGSTLLAQGSASTVEPEAAEGDSEGTFLPLSNAPASYAAQSGSPLGAGKLLELSANAILPVPAPRAPQSAWLSEGMRQRLVEEITGVPLRGYRYAGADPQAPTLLFFNGNGMTVFGADRLYRELARLGPTVVVYDYRGFGFSNGTPDMMKFREDGLQLYDRLAAAAPGHRVAVFGVSLGTAMATYVASQRAVAGLILGMPIASAQEELPVYGRLLGYPPAQLAAAVPSPEARAAFDEVGMVGRSQAPLLILHGTADDVVPIAQGREVLAASASARKQMVEVPGAGHGAAIVSPEAVLALAGFLQELR